MADTAPPKIGLAGRSGERKRPPPQFAAQRRQILALGPHGIVATFAMVVAAATSAPPLIGDQRKVDMH